MPDRDKTGRRDEPALDGSTTERVDRDEVLHLAELEAQCVIEPVEAARLERLFAAAAPSLQAEVRALQERIALDPLMRSSDEPSESLRLRTLGRVAQAIEEDAAVAAPLATIGPKAAAARAAASKRDGLTPDAVRSIIDGISRERERLQAVRQPYWRAAAFFLLAALCVSVYFNWRYVTVSEKLAGFANAEIIDSDMRQIAANMAGFDFGRSRHIDLTRAVAEHPAHVEVFTDPTSGRVAVIGVGFEVGETLEIVIRDPEGGMPYTQQFRVTAMGFGKVCEVPESVARAGLVEIRNSAGATIFRA